MRWFYQKMRSLQRAQQGQAMVEMALVLPIFLLLVMGIIEFGVLFGAQLSLENCAREGARYAAIHGNQADIAESVAAYVGDPAFTTQHNISVNFSPDGAVTVRVSSNMQALTLVGSLLFPDNTKTINADVTMKVE